MFYVNYVFPFIIIPKLLNIQLFNDPTFGSSSMVVPLRPQIVGKNDNPEGPLQCGHTLYSRLFSDFMSR
jgi:hypothetical protein